MGRKVRQGDVVRKKRRVATEHLDVRHALHPRREQVEQRVVERSEDPRLSPIMVAGENQRPGSWPHLRVKLLEQNGEPLDHLGSQPGAVEDVAGEDDQIRLVPPQRLRQRLEQGPLYGVVRAEVKVRQMNDAHAVRV